VGNLAQCCFLDHLFIQLHVLFSHAFGRESLLEGLTALDSIDFPDMANRLHHLPLILAEKPGRFVVNELRKRFVQIAHDRSAARQSLDQDQPE